MESIEFHIILTFQDVVVFVERTDHFITDYTVKAEH